MWMKCKTLGLTSLVILLFVALLGCPATTGPTATFSAHPSSGTAPLTVQFTDQSTKGSSTISTWQWVFGDGETGTQQNPSHEYKTPGTYPATLTVTTGTGSDTSPAQSIVVTAASTSEGEADTSAEGEGEEVLPSAEGEGEPGPVLSVTPIVRHVAPAAGSLTFSVANTGVGSCDWTASAGIGNWLRITEGTSGTNAGTITLEYDENTGAAQRAMDIMVTAAGAAHSPFVVQVGQDGTEAGVDSDSDGLTDQDEDVSGSDPQVQDTDADGLLDGDEVHLYNTSPIIADTDGDGNSDGAEISGGTNPLVPENAPKAYQDMTATIQEAGLHIKELSTTLPLSDALKGTADFLAAQPNVAAVHFSPGGADKSPMLWADFKDYASYVVLVSHKGAYDPDAKKARPNPEPPVGQCPPSLDRTPEKQLLSQGFPENPCAFANLFDVGTNTANTSKLVNMMVKRKYNATLTSGNAGGVEFFKTLADYGVVYLDTHGGFFADNKYVAKPTDPPGYIPYYCVVRTSDAQNALQDQAYLANGDFSSRRVMVSARIITRAGDLATVPAGEHYCVSNEFIKTYVGRFEDHSLVFLNCCQTAQLPENAVTNYAQAPLFSAFLSKNAGMILGWTESVGDKMAMKAGTYFFSRALGDNDAFDTQNPPIAPYDTVDAFGSLVNKHYDLDANPTAQLVGYIRGFNEDVLLAPKINFISTDLERKEITLSGNFGNNGTPVVKAGETQLTVKTRDDATIVAGLGDQDCGPVTVEILDHLSNAVPLTQWSGKLDLKGEAGALVPGVTGSIQCRWRGDIHSERLQFPEDEAKLPQMAMSTLELDSLYTWDFKSSYLDTSTRYDYSGSGSVHQSLNPSGSNWLAGNVIMHMLGGYIQFMISAVAEVQITATDLQSGDVQHYTLPHSVILTFQRPIDKFGAIAAGQTSSGSVQVTWTDFEVTGAPDDKTPAP